MARRPSTTLALQQLKPAALRTFHQALERWYKAHGRHDLPWRQTDDAYKIWLSEVMLQQTQVSTVLARFYQPFLNRFPTLESLADAPREKVMKAWEGLGYYTRAANLHKAAIIVVGAARAKRLNKAALPDQFEALLALPGIGRNTAHAVLAFAYHQPVAILEANVKRIVARIFALEHPADEQLWAGATALLDGRNPFHYNQSMMDMGSMVCTPKNPTCTTCPASTICRGKSHPESYPQKKIKKQIPTREVTITVRMDADGRIALTRRDNRLLGGLYGFVQSAAEAAPATAIGSISHTYSHFRLLGHVVIEQAAQTDSTFYTREQIATLPLSGADHKVLALVNQHARIRPAHHAQKHHTTQKKTGKSATHSGKKLTP